MTIKILHTSDWHIGQRLKEHDRTNEFISFFNWLENIIISQQIDILLVAGDIFDNSTPSVPSQNIYYSFLGRLAKSPCRNIIITSGNHDSPAFIDAPSELLKYCSIHVTGQASDNPAREVIALHEPEMIVCAVPFLRDRDVRKAGINDISTAEQALTEGIRDHYSRVFDYARTLQGPDTPIIAMGHLFVQGGVSGDTERSLYVGTSVSMKSDIFPKDITYTALGHLHSPQSVGRENIRYSGSPLAMSFAEAGIQKTVSIITLEGGHASISELPVPEFQRLIKLKGDIDEIEAGIKSLSQKDSSAWVDVTYTGNEVQGLQETINALFLQYEGIEILGVHDGNIRTPAEPANLPPGIDEIHPNEMLELCLDENNTPEEQRVKFRLMHQEIIRSLEEEGTL